MSFESKSTKRDLIHDQHEIYFERRRYGKKSFFTWVYVKINGKWHSSGDPLPKLNPSKAELSEAVVSAQRHSRF